LTIVVTDSSQQLSSKVGNPVGADLCPDIRQVKPVEQTDLVEQIDQRERQKA
jgi:hypothetical protein